MTDIPADPFVRAASWDAGVAADWAGRLNQRAAGDAQVRVRRRMRELARVRPASGATQ